MPLIFECNIGDTRKLGVWKITEDLSFFQKNLHQPVHPDLSQRRQIESACSRYMLNHLSGIRADEFLFKEENGRPVLKDSMISVSFSHSKDHLACLIDFLGKPVGVDIERIRDNIGSIAPKFVSETDSTSFNEINMHHQLIWGAKEVLFKIYAKGELDFKQHMHVYFDGKQWGVITKNGMHEVYPIQSMVINEFLLVWNEA